MKIMWLSANLFGWHLLNPIVNKVDAVITLSDTSKTVMYDKSPSFESFNIPLYKIDRINDESKLLRKLDPDIIIVAGWRQVINSELLDKYTFVGFHPTLLPYGRGPAPIINTILNRSPISGVTMFYLDAGVDSGDIIGQEVFMIDKDDTSYDVYKNIILCGIKLVKKYVPLLLDSAAPRTKQDDSNATYFPRLNDDFNKIDLDNNIDDIYSKIRALSYPYKGAYIGKNGKKLVIWNCELKSTLEVS